MFLEEIWSRNYKFIHYPFRISEIITALSLTAILRALIGLIPVSLFAIFLFGVSIYKLGFILIFLLLNLHIFGICLGILVSAGLIRFGPSFENIAWASLFFWRLWDVFTTLLMYYQIGFNMLQTLFHLFIYSRK